MKKTIAALFLCSCSILHAQENFKNDSVSAARPNELYLNVGPALSFLQGAFATNETNYSLMYKRALDKSRYTLSIGVAYKAETGNNCDCEAYLSPASSSIPFIDVTDSSRTKNYIYVSGAKKVQLNVGIERRTKIKRRFTGFTGMDLVSGILARGYSLYNKYQLQDQYGQWATVDKELLSYKKERSFYCGLSPKAGVSLAINSRFMISAQAAVLMIVNFGNQVEVNSDATGLNSNKSVTYDFGFNGIMDELNLVYRF